MFVLYDAMQETRDFDNKDFRVCLCDLENCLLLSYPIFIRICAGDFSYCILYSKVRFGFSEQI